jgi:hypothetical protein
LLELPLDLAALLVIIVVVSCGFLWPIWSEDARKQLGSPSDDDSKSAGQSPASKLA